MARVTNFAVGPRDDPEYDDPEIAAALRELTGSDGYRFSLAGEAFRLEIEGVSVAVANALRRSFYEMGGYALTFANGDFTSTEPFMTLDYVRSRLRQVPLNAEVARVSIDDYVWRLDATNPTKTPLDVRFGDLELVEGRADMPLFDPLGVIATLQPGRALRIENIVVVEGSALDDPAAFQQVARPAAVPLDVPEHPRKETHTKDGTAWAQSGYKVKSEVANPRRFAVTGVVQGVPAKSKATTRLVLRACDSILHRLKFVRGIVGRAGEATSRAESSAVTEGKSYFQIVPGHSDDGTPWHEATLTVTKETHTLGALLSRTIQEHVPDVGFCAYVCIPHENAMTLQLHHAVAEPGDLTAIVLEAVKSAMATLKTIRDGIAGR